MVRELTKNQRKKALKELKKLDDPYKRVFGVSVDKDTDLSSVRLNDLLARFSTLTSKLQLI